jgi:hypothetical protein
MRRYNQLPFCLEEGIAEAVLYGERLYALTVERIAKEV